MRISSVASNIRLTGRKTIILCILAITDLNWCQIEWGIEQHSPSDKDYLWWNVQFWWRLLSHLALSGLYIVGSKRPQCVRNDFHQQVSCYWISEWMHVAEKSQEELKNVYIWWGEGQVLCVLVSWQKSSILLVVTSCQRRILKEMKSPQVENSPRPELDCLISSE